MTQHNNLTHEQQTTVTIQKLSDPSGVTRNNQPSLTFIADSNSLDVRQIIAQERNTQQPDDTSTTLASNTNITQPFPTHHTSPRKYEPPPVLPQCSTHNTPHNNP